MLNKNQKLQVKKDHVAKRTDGTLPGTFDFDWIDYRSQPETACWRWDAVSKKHIIKVNENVDKLMDRTIADKKLGPTQIDKGVPYGGNYAVSNKRHEDAHALWTEGDFKLLQELLTKESEKQKLPFVPHFGRFNLFEDARIEDKYRRTFKTRFNWQKYEFSYLERTTREIEVHVPKGTLTMQKDPKTGSVVWFMTAHDQYVKRPAATPVDKVSADELFQAIIQLEKNGKALKALKAACAAAATIGDGPYTVPKRSRAHKGEKCNAAALFGLILAYYRKVTNPRWVNSTKDLIFYMVQYSLDFITDEEKTGEHGKPGSGSGEGTGARSSFDASGGDKHGGDWKEAIEEAIKEGKMGTSPDAHAQASDRGEKEDEGNPSMTTEEAKEEAKKDGKTVVAAPGKTEEGKPEEKKPAKTETVGKIDGGESTTSGSYGEVTATGHYTSDPKKVKCLTPNPALGAQLRAEAKVHNNGKVPGCITTYIKNPYFADDWPRVQRLVPMLERALQAKVSTEKTISPRKRLNIRGLVTGSEKIFKGRTVGRGGIPKVMMIYDCSGSMSGYPHNQGLILLGAMNELHRRKRIDLRLFCTYGDNAYIKTPFPNEALFHLATPGGCEGFKNTLRVRDKDVMWSDFVLTYTDAQITDDPIDNKYWRVRGKSAVGLYCGEASEIEEMKKYFTHSIIRMTIEQVCNTLVKVMKAVQQ